MSGPVSGSGRKTIGGVRVRGMRLLVLVFGFGASSLAIGPAQPPRRPTLVVWLIPSEPAMPSAGIGGLNGGNDCEAEATPTGTLRERIEEEIERFNVVRSRTRVTVINTQEPFKAQLIDWSPEMAVPNWV